MKEAYDDLEPLVKTKPFKDIFRQEDGPMQVAIFNRNTRTERMVNQQGLFTISRNIMGDHGECIEKVMREPEGNEVLFSKVTIPAGLKLDFLRRLRSMNVTAASLFPGLDGIGRSIAEKVNMSQVLGYRVKRGMQARPDGQEIRIEGQW